MFSDEQKKKLAGDVWKRTRGKSPESFGRVLAPYFKNARTRRDVAEVVWGVFRRADLVLKPVLAALKAYEKGGHPEWACDLLHDMGSAGAAAVPALITLLGATTDYDTLWAAACALEAIGPDSAPSQDLLLKLLGHASGRVASSAGRALVGIGTSTIPGLVKIIETGEPRAREFAADALGLFGPAAKEAIPALARINDDPSQPEGAWRAWMTLAGAEITLDREMAPALLIMTGEQDQGLVDRARSLLNRLGVTDAEAVKAMRRELREPKAAGDAEGIDAWSRAIEVFSQK